MNKLSGKNTPEADVSGVRSRKKTLIETVGVIGAGQMGTGIAHVFALADYTVHLSDVSEKQIARSHDAIGRNMDRQIKRGIIGKDEKEKALAQIHATTKLDSLVGCDLVIEAATENEEIKKQIFKDVCPKLKPSALLCSNTSSISITRLGAGTDRPEKFMGLHFMNPVPMMKLVELIRGIATADSTFAAIRTVTKKLGKSPISSTDFPAFVVNRVLIPMINEAIYALYEGVGNVDAIDTAMKLGANHPMGPLELADFIGLDTCLSIMTVLYEGLADSKYRPCPLLVKYVEAGWLGRKANKGFYDYSADKPVPTR